MKQTGCIAALLVTALLIMIGSFRAKRIARHLHDHPGIVVLIDHETQNILFTSRETPPHIGVSSVESWHPGGFIMVSFSALDSHRFQNIEADISNRNIDIYISGVKLEQPHSYGGFPKNMIGVDLTESDRRQIIEKFHQIDLKYEEFEHSGPSPEM